MEQNTNMIIELDNTSKSYFSGAVITGRVIVPPALSATQGLLGLAILVYGKAQVRWSGSKNYSNSLPNGCQTLKAFVAAEEEYYSQVISVTGKNRRSDGSVVYPFALKLPAHLPASYAHIFGRISYVLKAELTRTNVRAEIPVLIPGALNLNTSGRSGKSQIIREDAHNGRLEIDIHMSKFGFVPGENLDFTCVVRNSSSSKTVRYVEASLIQTTKFRAQKKSKLCVDHVLKVLSPSVEPETSIKWAPVDCLVPALLPTGMGGNCALIDIQYHLQFRIKCSGFLSTDSILCRKLPIVIGTVPLLLQ